MYGTKVANAAGGEITMTATKERQQHGGGVVLGVRSVTEGGISTSVGHSARNECALDVMLGNDIPEKGMLAGTQGTMADRRAVARSRYEAGMKLRRMFLAAGLQALKAHDLGATSKGDGASDAQDAMRSRYNNIMRRLGLWGEIASGVCCYDAVPTHSAWQDRVRQSLDKLCALEG